ncbi:phage tail family protein [Microbacterium karelineae]|uniref:phage tail family protein n=1 Tax=Microbacterium karelineae TaxID=2654283 RepID=UPI0018D30A71|nr:phage tail family protein [Microbacterium karelineae]
MSFTYGSFTTDSLGLIATLTAWPSLAGLQLETLEAPGTDGLILGGATRSSTRFAFDVIVSGETPEDAATKRDSLVLALDPARGERQLQIDAMPGWQWRAIAAGGIDWERLTWDTGLGFQFRGEVAFEVLSAYGRPTADETWSYAAPGSRQITRQEGNARSFPTVEIEGTLSSSETVTVRVGDVVTTIPGPLTSAQVLRLDYDTFDFARWNGSTKVASVVRPMTSLDRAELWPHEAATFAVSTTGTVSAVRLYANSRLQ